MLKNKLCLSNEYEDIIELVKEAQKIGRNAAQCQLAKLEKSGPRWRLRDAFTGKSAGTMLDVCGFGGIKIKGNSKIVKAFKKLGERDGDRYLIEGMYISKSYYQGGYYLELKLTNSQYLSVNEEAVRQAAEFLDLMGLEVRWESRID